MEGAEEHIQDGEKIGGLEVRVGAWREHGIAGEELADDGDAVGE